MCEVDAVLSGAPLFRALEQLAAVALAGDWYAAWFDPGVASLWAVPLPLGSWREPLEVVLGDDGRIAGPGQSHRPAVYLFKRCRSLRLPAPVLFLRDLTCGVPRVRVQAWLDHDSSAEAVFALPATGDQP